MSSAKMILEFSITSRCPNCDHLNDLDQQNDDGYFTTPIFNNKWDDLKGAEVICEKCEEEFEIESVEI